MSERGGNPLGLSTTPQAGSLLSILLPLGISKEVNLSNILGVTIGLITSYFQNYLSHFINHCKLFSKFYEPPTNASQAYIWFKEVRKLDCFNKGLKDVRQLALFGGVFDIGLKIAAFRQFNSGWQTVFGGF